MHNEIYPYAWVQVTEAAARACAALIGRGDKHAADQVAVHAMRQEIENIPVRGKVVIGEGERDEAPMLFIGEHVGAGWRHHHEYPRMDIAVDPLEGTNLCAHDSPGAITVLAVSEEGNLLHAPDTYMNKIAVGPMAKGAIDLHKSPTWNLAAIAEAKRCQVDELTAVILDRERHKPLIAEVRKAGARIKLITDGDVAGALATAQPESGVDVLLGMGGAPEGVLAAAALRCVGGEFQGQLRYRNEDEKKRAEKMGILDHFKLYRAEDLAKGRVLFAATGVTTGLFLEGVVSTHQTITTHSMILDSADGSMRFLKTTLKK